MNLNVPFQEPPFIFRATSLPENKKTEIYFKDETKNVYYYGYCIDLIHKISEKMHFDYKIYEPEDGAYGTMQEDGSWNGMVNELIQDVGWQHNYNNVMGTFAVILSKW